MLRSRDNTQLLLYTTTDLTDKRIYTLMHDPQYRVAVAHENSAYNQPLQPSFLLGNDMAAAPTPNIILAGDVVTGTRSATKAESVVSVYPNPTAGTMRIKTPGAFTYRIYDQVGKEVESGTARDEYAAGSKLKAGIYVIKVQAAGTAETFKIVKH